MMGNGVGDLNGIIEKFDYLKIFQVDVFWLILIYDFLQYDNGYDICDYYLIYFEYGMMEDFEWLLFEVYKRGLKVVMDFVVNYILIEYKWF